MKPCNKCGVKVLKRNRYGWVCDKHGRFIQMRFSSRYRNKKVPTFEELEELSKSLNCPKCQKEMVWRSPKGLNPDLVTIQHDRSGKVKLLCHGCNSKHSHLSDKVFYHLKLTEKYCNRCEKVKLKSEFWPARNTTDKCQTYCIPCMKKINSEYSKNVRYQKAK
jgi:hypothetical protein